MITSAENRGHPDPDDAILAQAYWVDVDVELSGIARQRLSSPLKFVGHRPLSLLEDCVLVGVGAVGIAPNEASGGADKHNFAVRISKNSEDPAGQPWFDRHAGCQVVWDKRSDRSWQSTIYISDFMLRHIVEFFVTKRIDNVRLSIQVSVWENAPIEPSFSSGSLWSQPGFLSDKHTRCRLLSVFTSKGKM